MMPRYARPTKSTSLYSYTNRDQDLIKQGFGAGNFTFLAKFPPRITPFGISAALKANSKRVITSKPRTQSVRKMPLGYGWIPDSYNLKSEHLRRLRLDSVNKRRAISTKDFISSGTPSRLKERNSSQKSSTNGNNSFSSVTDQVSRLKWIRDTQIKHGDFRMGKSLDSNQTRSNVQNIISVVKKKIASDWESTDFDIGVNSKDCIEVRFHMRTLESTESMHYYMNILVNKTQEIGKFGLKKVQNQWGSKQDRFLVFVIAPAWVRLPIRQAFNSLNLKKSLNPPTRLRRKSLWSTPVTHISTRDSNNSIH